MLQGTAEVAAGPIPAGLRLGLQRGARALPLRSGEGQGAARGGRRRGRPAHLLRHRGRFGHARSGRHGHRHPGGPAAVGVNVNIQTYEWNTFLGTVNPGLEGKADMAEMAWMTTDPDTLPFLTLRTEACPTRAASTRATTPTPRSTSCSEAARRRPTGRARRALQGDAGDGPRDAPWVFVANWKQNAVTTPAVAELPARSRPSSCCCRTSPTEVTETRCRGRTLARPVRPAEERSMSAYILKRLLAAIPVVFGLSVMVFLVMSLIPGDPALAILGALRDARQRRAHKPRARPR